MCGLRQRNLLQCEGLVKSAAEPQLLIKQLPRYFAAALGGGKVNFIFLNYIMKKITKKLEIFASYMIRVIMGFFVD